MVKIFFPNICEIIPVINDDGKPQEVEKKAMFVVNSIIKFVKLALFKKKTCQNNMYFKNINLFLCKQSRNVMKKKIK